MASVEYKHLSISPPFDKFPNMYNIIYERVWESLLQHEYADDDNVFIFSAVGMVCDRI